ncbi:MAG TPA: sigma-70 family RNA polymerase sigma factor [Alphaproteobacteria bacterium]|jgi:RNA polymerase sigma-70 factor (ECF subfamily)
MENQHSQGAAGKQNANDLIPEIPYLRRYARALTRNAADADDLVQTALMRAIANIDQFQPDTNLRGWLMKIVHNVFIDGTRKAKRARDNEDGVIDSQRTYAPADQIDNLAVGDLQKALDRLPEEQRITLVLVALEDMTYEEAAAVTGVPVGTVRSRLSRARHALTRMVEGLTMEDVSPESGITRRRPRKPVAQVLNVATAEERPSNPMNRPGLKSYAA